VADENRLVDVETPYTSMSGGTDALRSLVEGDDERHYLLWFQTPGVAEAVMDPKVRLLFEAVLRGGISPEQAAPLMLRDGKFDMNLFRRLDEFDPPGEPFASTEELDYYVAAFEKMGFRGGINWYRNIDANAQDIPDMGKRELNIPCLMLTAERDMALPPALAADMPTLCSDLETHT
jgi:hypothetical protein